MRPSRLVASDVFSGALRLADTLDQLVAAVLVPHSLKKGSMALAKAARSGLVKVMPASFSFCSKAFSLAGASLRCQASDSLPASRTACCTFLESLLNQRSLHRNGLGQKM